MKKARGSDEELRPARAQTEDYFASKISIGQMVVTA
jgi:hypothetical protein